MRYDKRIYFVKEGEDVYDYTTGNHIPGEAIKTEAWANISDMGTERQTLIFGGLKQGALTVRIQGKYEKPFDYIEHDGKTHKVENARTFRNDQVFEVSEIL